MKQPRILIDNKIPYIKGVFEPHAQVSYLAPSEIDREVMRDTDVLITRTRTRCNEALLAGSPCQLIATATIGFDHIDTAYCDQHHIAWCNAPGCNATSVAQYVLSCLVLLQQKQGWEWSDRTIGIVGVGHVGSAVAKVCQLLGMQVLLNDPPRARKEGSEGFVSLQEIAQTCDIISFHAPLTREGTDATYHLADASFFDQCKSGVTIINTARGEVVCNMSLYHAYQMGEVDNYIIDCWENEPNIHLPLLERAFIATPHIAGYSADGKCNATRMTIDSVARYLNLAIDTSTIQPIAPAIDTIDLSHIYTNKVAAAILATYHPMADMHPLVASPHLFETLRSQYPLRRESCAYKVVGCGTNSERELLSKLGFRGV